MDSKDVALVSSLHVVVALHRIKPNSWMGQWYFDEGKFCLHLARRVPCWQCQLAFDCLTAATFQAWQERKNRTQDYAEIIYKTHYMKLAAEKY